MIFDSDVLVWFSRGEPAAVELVNATEDRAASIITLMELLQGVKSKAELRTTKQFFEQSAFRILPVTETIGDLATSLIEEHRLASGIQVADALIAATALDSGETLATANVRHFRAIARLHLKSFRPRRL